MADRRTDAEVLAVSLVEPRAFMVVFDRHFGAIARYLGRRLRWSVAEELTAEVFATAFASRFRYDVRRADALPWLYGISANLLRAHARREERELELLARTAADPLASRFESTDELAGLEPSLAAGLLRLSVDEREVLLLFAWADLGYEQIAEALAVPVGTVKSRLNRARGALRAALGDDASSLQEVSHG
jgi:RNA polymerase sigma factor (sigma-70 family)